MIWILIGIFVMAIYILRPVWLQRQSSFTIVLLFSAACFGVAFASEWSDLHLNNPTRALYTPLFSAGLYRFLRFGFLRRFSREPIDVVNNSAPGLLWDRAFAFVFWTGNILFLIFMIAPAK